MHHDPQEYWGIELTTGRPNHYDIVDPPAAETIIGGLMFKCPGSIEYDLAALTCPL